MSPAQALERVATHEKAKRNMSRAALIASVLEHREALELPIGALATWTRAAETGRIPKDTYIVRHAASEAHIDWSSPTCIPMESAVFDQLLNDALDVLKDRQEVFVSDRSLGADAAFALPVRVVTDSPLTALFCENMFRPAIHGNASVFGDKPFTLIALPHTKLSTEKYQGVLREVDGKVVDMCIAMDFDRRIGFVYGTAYCGAVKKLMFTVMNYLLPEHDVLPLHCSANEDATGKTTLFLGLSGTGKTTLSMGAGMTLIGDDEHLWSENGVANLENGSYAKLIRLDATKETQIHSAVFSHRATAQSGVIIENAMVYPNGTVDVDDDRFAENSRASYPLDFLPSAKPGACGTHPETIIFLTADANGVLPPIARLTTAQAMLWFLMGYTSKLAGTETGITTPVSAFSRFFGGPFMPRNPKDYADLLAKRMSKHGTHVYVVNTGWTGGGYGTGKRMDIDVTRAIVQAVQHGTFDSAVMREDPLWKFSVPTSCPGVESTILDPERTWKNPEDYAAAAEKLAQEFAAAFTKTFGKTVTDPVIRAACPGL
jgi:phosphoenolpyruvate carboxykinase (ATP)